MLGDCRDRLAELPDDSVDAVVCDPPYGLSKEPDIAEVLDHWLAGDEFPRASLSQGFSRRPRREYRASRAGVPPTRFGAL